jgi:adenylylsulfate kinase
LAAALAGADLLKWPGNWSRIMDVEKKATNIVWHCTQVARLDRENLLHQRGSTIWLTGLPSSGKSTTAFTLEYELTRRGLLAYVLDGDNVRHGLNKDLAFSARDREENIRRVAEVAKLFADAGFILITSFISPYRKERDFARRIHSDAGLDFVEVFVDTPIDECERRDPKCLYQKARRGELKGFTGVDDPYEPPVNPEITVKTAEYPPQEIAAQIMAYLAESRCIPTEFNVIPPGTKLPAIR